MGSVDFPSDDATEQRAREDGYACAQSELESGHPGYFYHPADSDYIDAMDKETGLPIFRYGDALRAGCMGWIHGFNQGTQQFIAEHGLPWNSRLGFIAELADIGSNFLKRSQIERPASLGMDGPPQSSPGGSVSLELMEEDSRLMGRERSVLLSSSRLYCGQYAGAYRLGRITATECGHAAPGNEVPTKPSLQPGTKQVELRFFGGADQIEFFWGPADSELCFFRFEGVFWSRGERKREERFAALDLQLGDWLPSYVPGLTEECNAPSF